VYNYAEQLYGYSALMEHLSSEKSSTKTNTIVAKLENFDVGKTSTCKKKYMHIPKVYIVAGENNSLKK
jgi:hypothetical protein